MSPPTLVADAPDDVTDVPPDESAPPPTPRKKTPKPRGINYDSETVKAKALELVKACLEDSRNDTARLDRDRQDWLNLLFYRGGVDNQWVVWDKSSNAWVPRPYDEGDSALPGWVPRATTNLYAKKIDGITAILDQSQPAQEWAPATDDDADLATAKVCDEAVPVLRDEITYDVLRRQMNKHVALMDKVALCLYYDTDEQYGTSQIQALQCPSCGWQGMPMEVADAEDACPECGAPGDTLEPLLDAQAQPVGVDYPKGRMRAELIPSFEFSLPRSARISDEQMVPWVLLHTRMSYEAAIRLWPDAEDLIESTKRQSGGSSPGVQRHYADAMTRLASPRSTRTYSATGMGDQVGPIVYRLHHDPIDDKDYHFPDGLYVAVIDDTVVDCGPLPVKDDDGHPVKSILIRTYAQAPGSPFNKPPADDLVPLQYWRNLIESLVALTLIHEAAPRTFIPATVTLEDDITGQPGQQIRFRSHVPGERPFTEPGIGASDSLYKYLELIDAKFEEISSLNAVLMGARPQGDPTLGEVQILQERGLAAFKTPLDNLVEFEKRLAKLLIWIARQSAWAPRFRRVMGENGQWALEQFAGADLTGRVDVMSDPATAWPKSPLMTNLKLKEAVGMGVIVPQQDPELSMKVLRMMDLANLKPSMDDARSQVARHLDLWKRAKSPMELQLPFLQPQPWWNLALHAALKTAFLNTEVAEALSVANPPVYQWMAAHVQALQAQIQQQQMMAAMAQQGPPPASKNGKGDGGAALEHALQSGALKPGAPPAPAKPNPLEHAIRAGALQPGAPAPPPQPPPPAPSMDDLIAQGVLSPSITAQQPPSGPV